MVCGLAAACFCCSSVATWAAVTPSGMFSSLRSLAISAPAFLRFLPLGITPTSARTGRKAQLGGLADDVEDLLLVGGPGELHDDGVALAGDLGFGHAEGVDALADDADGLIELLGRDRVVDLAVLDRLEVDRDAALEVEAEVGVFAQSDGDRTGRRPRPWWRSTYLNGCLVILVLVDGAGSGYRPDGGDADGPPFPRGGPPTSCGSPPWPSLRGPAAGSADARCPWTRLLDETPLAVELRTSTVSASCRRCRGTSEQTAEQRRPWPGRRRGRVRPSIDRLSPWPPVTTSWSISRWTRPSSMWVI